MATTEWFYLVKITGLCSYNWALIQGLALVQDGHYSGVSIHTCIWTNQTPSGINTAFYVCKDGIKIFEGKSYTLL